MDKRQVILIGIIIVFGFGLYAVTLIMSSKMENSSCGQYMDQLQREYYSECLDSGKTAQVCDSDATEKAWDGTQGMQDGECRKLLDEN